MEEYRHLFWRQDTQEGPVVAQFLDLRHHAAFVSVFSQHLLVWADEQDARRGVALQHLGDSFCQVFHTLLCSQAGGHPDQPRSRDDLVFLPEGIQCRLGKGLDFHGRVNRLELVQVALQKSRVHCVVLGVGDYHVRQAGGYAVCQV